MFMLPTSQLRVIARVHPVFAMNQGFHYSCEIKFKDFSRTPGINFQQLNIDISSYYYTLHDISPSVKLHAIKLKPH